MNTNYTLYATCCESIKCRSLRKSWRRWKKSSVFLSFLWERLLICTYIYVCINVCMQLSTKLCRGGISAMECDCHVCANTRLMALHKQQPAAMATTAKTTTQQFKHTTVLTFPTIIALWNQRVCLMVNTKVNTFLWGYRRPTSALAVGGPAVLCYWRMNFAI